MESGKPMTAEERRERRRRKILENSESRMSTILSGPDGTETRNAPAMEGGDVYSAPTSSAESSVPSSPRLPPKPVPTFCHFLDNNRRLLSFLFGLLCRCVMLFTGLNANIIIPWFLIYISLEFYVLRKIRTTSIFPEQFQPLLQMLPKEILPFDISFVSSGITILRELAQDTMFMTAGFILTQYSLVLSDTYISRT